LLSGSGVSALAQSAVLNLSIKDHKFEPAEVRAPADQPITVTVKNLDSSAAEFESKDLKVEKIVAGGGEITLHVRPLAAGRYRFFDDFHEKTTEGFIV